MKVAKLSTGDVVLFLKKDTPLFTDHEMALVSKRITENPRRVDPFWVEATLVVWILEFK